MAEIMESKGNVLLIDPNKVNANLDMVNSVPQYQDMHIFTELTAISKGRTVSINGNVTSTESKKINFLGNNQNDNNPNNLNFTTNYYDGSTGNETHYEGFGITDIKIVINSSFIPQVNIQFVDIRGLAFFNQQDSPYRVLFDFPPPIFTLTVKGYYGKAIKYELHLVKYTSEFKAENGNFIIDAQFVAVTFAPLTDILFRYVVNTPLITKKESSTPNTGEKPDSTYDLILKLKNLYKAIQDKLDTDIDNKEYKSIRSEIEIIGEILNTLKYINESEILKKGGNFYLVAKTPKPSEGPLIYPATRTSENYNLTIIKTLSEFNDLIKNEENTGIKSTLNNRLVILYVAGTNIPLAPEDYQPIPETQANPILNPFQFPSENNDNFKLPLLEYKKQLMGFNLIPFGINDDDIQTPSPFTNEFNILSSKNVETKYYGMDITNYYYKLYKKNQELNDSGNELSLQLAKKINNMVSERLGMVPSIYNIFSVILNDVDEFFNILKKTSDRADIAHNTPAAIKIIANNNIDSPTSEANIPDHIYPFPLIINESPIHGGTKKERIAPIELSKETEFPELDLVSNFMDTFLLQNKLEEQANLRENQNDDGTNKWIPISPFDSTLGGVSPESPYINQNDDIRTEVLKILLKRFYILTQGTIYDSFYKLPLKKRGPENKAYVRLYSNAEAINLTASLVSKQNAETIRTMAHTYSNNLNQFYTDIEKISDTYYNGSEFVTGSLYDFPSDDPKYFPITPANNTGRVYTNKNNPDFVGVNIYGEDIILQTSTDTSSSTNPIDNFNKDSKKEFLTGGIFKGSPAENLFDFTQENVIYIRDNGTAYDEHNMIIDNVLTSTRYLYGAGFPTYTDPYTGRINTAFPGKKDPVLGQQIAYSGGNLTFGRTLITDKRSLGLGRNIIYLWIQTLSNSKYQSVVNTLLTGTNLSAMLITSNFGYTVSPFNMYPNELNPLVFDTPSAVEVPAFYSPYIGMLLTAIDEGWDSEILEFFTGSTGDNGIGSVLNNKGYLVLADLHDVQNYLSDNDKAKFIAEYNAFSSTISDIVEGVRSLRQDVINNTGEGKPFKIEKLFGNNINNGYEFYLNPEADEDNYVDGVGKGTKSWLLERMMVRTNIINFSQLTFKMTDTYNIGYTSLATLRNPNTPNSVEINEINQTFFQTLFGRLDRELKNREDELKEKEEELKKAKGDIDIITQLYYSFKNINDKWLTGNINSNNYYPFNKPNKKLIDSFAFVDRAMNPIGETIINAELLIELLEDPNVSLFTVLSQLLSLNGFEFFPLQNFMSFSEGGWEDSFKIHNGGINDNTSTSFVCMYVGGSSSYPSLGGNGFVDDGITDISEPGVADFSTSKEQTSSHEENTKQLKNNDFPWQQVRAFRVQFGEQNQSMFQNIKIDSKEYPETNESIQILSRLAGDNNPDAPVPKGQNLYNLYENRSYKATVTGFGNAMIQPTQYFQLENIPLFNGAYIILSVEHSITANKMTTNFSGTKLLKYPIPRVLNPVAFTNFNSNLSAGDIILEASNYVTAASNREETHYTSMYENTSNTLKIQ